MAQSVKERVLDHIARNPHSSVGDIVRGTRASAGGVRRIVTELQYDHKIIKHRDQSRVTWTAAAPSEPVSDLADSVEYLFKVQGAGDTIYFNATSAEAARARVRDEFGVPEEVVKTFVATRVDALPVGEELFQFPAGDSSDYFDEDQGNEDDDEQDEDSYDEQNQDDEDDA